MLTNLALSWRPFANFRATSCNSVQTILEYCRSFLKPFKIHMHSFLFSLHFFFFFLEANHLLTSFLPVWPSQNDFALITRTLSTAFGAEEQSVLWTISKINHGPLSPLTLWHFIAGQTQIQLQCSGIEHVGSIKLRVHLLLFAFVQKFLLCEQCNM